MEPKTYLATGKVLQSPGFEKAEVLQFWFEANEDTLVGFAQQSAKVSLFLQLHSWAT